MQLIESNMFYGYQQSKTYWTIELIQNSQQNYLVIPFFRATDDPQPSNSANF